MDSVTVHYDINCLPPRLKTKIKQADRVTVSHNQFFTVFGTEKFLRDFYSLVYRHGMGTYIYEK